MTVNSRIQGLRDLDVRERRDKVAREAGLEDRRLFQYSNRRRGCNRNRLIS